MQHCLLLFYSARDEGMNTNLYTDLDFNIWILPHQAKDALFKAREKELSKYSITAMEARSLLIIKSIGDKATPAEISRWIFRGHHTVAALLSRMEKKKLITKTHYSGRKTRSVIGLTEKGQKALRQSLKRDYIHEVLSALSDKDR